MKAKTVTSTTDNAAVDALSPRKARNIIKGCTLERVQAAFQAYARWLRRQARTEHPDGSFDNANRWEPSAEENCDNFTRWIRSPSRAWPNTYMKAARSLEHCEALNDVKHTDVLLLRRAGLLDGLDKHISTKDARRKAGEAWAALRARAGLTVVVIQQVAPAGTVAANDDEQKTATA